MFALCMPCLAPRPAPGCDALLLPRRQWLGLGCLGSDASTTSGSPPLSEQLLHVCGQALYPHLDLASRRCLRLVSKAARDAIDASVARLQLPEQRFKHSGKLIPIPQQVLRACARRWRSARHLAVNDFLDLHILPARLEGLEVRSCLAQPTPDSLAPLRAAAGSLQCLRVRCNALNAHGVCALASALRQLPQLTKLQLSGSQLGEEAAHALAPALLFLTRLTSLEVSNTHMAHRWQGAGAQALAPSLSCLLRLEHLHLAVGLGREGVEALAPVLAGLPALRHVDLSSNALEDGPLQCPASGSGSGGTTTALIPAATTAAAGSLGIGCVVLPLRPLQVALCCLGSSLSSLPCLQSLNLSFNRLGPSVSALAVALCDSHAPHLRTLGLAGSGLRGQGAAVAKLLCPLTALTGLDLSFNDFSADDARQLAPALAALPRLHSIDLGSNDLGDAGAAALAPALRRMDGLASLSLAAISVTGAGAAHVASALDCLPQLQALNVRSLVACQPGAGGQSHSGQLHAMRFLLPLAQMTGLLELDVGGSALGLVGATNLAKAVLPFLPQLRHMYARSAGFRDDSLALLAPCLKTHQLQLRRLVLADNEFSAQGLVPLLTAVRELPLLRQLDLSSTYWWRKSSELVRLGREDVSSLMPLLRRMHSLQQLSLGQVGTADKADRRALLVALPGLTKLDI